MTFSKRPPSAVFIWCGMSLLVGLCLCLSATRSLALEAGEKLPAFEIPALDGKIYRSSDYVGRILVFEWTNYSCPFVGKLYKSGKLSDMQERYGEQAVVWFSVASGSSADIEKLRTHEFAAKRKVEAVLLDPKGDLARAFGARTAPHVFVVGADGEIAYEGAVDDNRSTSVDDALDGRNFVSEALNAILAGKLPEVKAARPYGCALKFETE